jgi:hypothetical protein
MKQIVAKVEHEAATRSATPMAKNLRLSRLAPDDVGANQQAAEEPAPEQHGPGVGVDQPGEQPGRAERQS